MTKSNLHPIQHTNVRVKQIKFCLDDDRTLDDVPEKLTVATQFRHHDFDSETKTLQIDVRVAIGVDDETIPFELIVELNSLFTVDTNEFSEGLIDSWAKGNGCLLMMPYLREHVHSLTSRVGIKELHLPLVNLPAFGGTDKPKDTQPSIETNN